MRRAWILGLALVGLAARASEGQVPASLVGTWRVEKILTVAKTACWDEIRGKELMGSELEYGAGEMVWKGGAVPLIGLRAVDRTLTRAKYEEEYGVTLKTLGIAAGSVQEVDLQHEDADVTGDSTEVPGDTVVLAGAGRIVVSACGVYYEAVRVRR